MERWFLYAGMALCLFSLWAIGRRDLVRLRGRSRAVPAEVTGHRISRDADGITHAAIYTFHADSQQHEVIDQVYYASPRPPIGTMVTLHYPEGHPDLARVPRPALWLFVYGTLVVLFGVLAAKAAGLLPD